MDSNAMIYVPSLIKIDPGIQKLIGEWIPRQTGRRLA
jgi:hypothetical protein